MHRVALVDTSNFYDYPTGGQLTSIMNFLKYVAEKEDSNMDFLLIGITRIKGNVGRMQRIRINKRSFDFLPVAYDDNDPNNPKKSLRKGFMKGLLYHRSLIDKQRIDLFFIHTPEAYLPLKLFFYTKKFVVLSHGSFYNIFDNVRFDMYKNNLVKFLVNKYIKFLLSTSDMIFVLDEQSLKEYGVYNKNVLKVNNSIDYTLYQKEYNNIGEEVRALFVGRLSENKRVDRIIQALYRMEEKFILDIVGDGEEYTRLKKLIDELGLGKRINMVGKKTPLEVCDYYKKANILILNSDKEGLPMVILEAMAAGLCILSTPVGAVRDVIKDEINGYLLDGSVESICRNLARASNNLTKFYICNTEEAKKYSYKGVNEFMLHKIEEKIKYPKSYITGGQQI